MDAEVRRILDECYGQARATLTEHRDRLARAPLATETLDADQAHEAAGPAPRTAVDDPLRPAAHAGSPAARCRPVRRPVSVGER